MLGGSLPHVLLAKSPLCSRSPVAPPHRGKRPRVPTLTVPPAQPARGLPCRAVGTRSSATLRVGGCWSRQLRAGSARLLPAPVLPHAGGTGTSWAGPFGSRPGSSARRGSITLLPAVSVPPSCSWGAPEGQRNEAFCRLKAISQPVTLCLLCAGALGSACAPRAAVPGGLAEVPGWGRVVLALLPSPCLRWMQRGEAGCGQLGLQLLCCLGEGKNKVFLPPLCRAGASAVCCIRHEGLVPLCPEHTFVGGASPPSTQRSAAVHVYSGSCPSLLTWVQRAGAGLLELGSIRTYCFFLPLE